LIKTSVSTNIYIYINYYICSPFVSVALFSFPVCLFVYFLSLNDE